MRNLPIGIVLLISVLSAQAQILYKGNPECLKRNAEKIIVNTDDRTMKYIQILQDYSLTNQALPQYLQKAYDLKLPAKYRLVSKYSDRSGMLHSRYQQLVNAVPVLGGEFNIHEKEDRIMAVNGTLHDIREQDGNIVLTEREALKIALDNINAEKYAWEDSSKEKFIKYIKNSPSATFYPAGELFYIPYKDHKKTGQHVLAYKFDIYALKPLRRTEVYINVTNGEIELTLEKIINSYSEGTAVTKYSGTRPITTEYYNGSYRLRDGTKGNGIETFNMNNSENTGMATDFTDADNYWNNFNPYQDEVATDAHWATEMTYDYFYNIHGYNSIDNAGFKLISYVHYGYDFVNAFWDGYSMTYGDGNDTIGPFTTLDVVGHETTHGLSQFSADFIYSGEPGGLCEGFSDIFGTCVEFYARPERANWLNAEDIGFVIRSLSDPKSCQLPDTYQGEYWWDIQDPHYWCGPFEYWFYLLSEGGSGINDLDYSYNINGIGMEKAEQIAFRTLVVYLTSGSGYSDARDYSILAAIDLYGMCSDEVQAVTDAWVAVGMPASSEDSYNLGFFQADNTVFCTVPATVNFYSSLGEDATHFWLFGDGTVSTLSNPEHTYLSPGDYTICHTVQIVQGNCQGNASLIKQDYIKVYEPGNCFYIFPDNGADTLDLCHALLYDNGGEQNNYSENINSRLTIRAPAATNIRLFFEYYYLESGYDYLLVYDGETDSAPLLATLTGSGINYIISSSSNSVTLRFFSDEIITDRGFKLLADCNMPGFQPVADFDIVPAAYNQFYFINLSRNDPRFFLWYFGDGGSSTLENPFHQYTQSGLYDVSLTATNPYGSHTATRYACINITSSDGPDPLVGETADLLQITENGNTVTVHSKTPMNSVRIYNSLGQLIRTSADLPVNTYDYEFSLCDFTCDLYLIQVQTRTGIFNKKMIFKN